MKKHGHSRPGGHRPTSSSTADVAQSSTTSHGNDNKTTNTKNHTNPSPLILETTRLTSSRQGQTEKPSLPQKSPPTSSDEKDEETSDEEISLDGMLVRNPDVSSSSTSSEEDGDDDHEDDEQDDDDVNEEKGDKDDDDSKTKAKPAGDGRHVAPKRNKNKADADGNNADSKIKSFSNKQRPDTTQQHSTRNKKSNKKKRKRNNNDDDDDDDDDDNNDDDDDDDDNNDDELFTRVDFIYCDIQPQFFDGLRSLLPNSSTVYQRHAAAWADAMIANVAIGTVLGTHDDPDANVYGFASILNMSTTMQQQPHNTAASLSSEQQTGIAAAMQYMIHDILQKSCPAEHATHLNRILAPTPSSKSSSTLASKTKASKGVRPTGLLLHGRVMNLSLEVVLLLHQQLCLDLDWAIQHGYESDDDPDDTKDGIINHNNNDIRIQQKSAAMFDFAWLLRVAPCQQERKSGTVIYRFFDDEIMAGRAEWSYITDAPKSYSKEQKQLLCIMAIQQSEYRHAVQDLARMVGS